MESTKVFESLFLSIGAMKAGTTWLYAVLSQHPSLHFAMEKEIHYFHHRYLQKGPLTERARVERCHNGYLRRNTVNIDRLRKEMRWVSAYLDCPVDDYWYRNLFHMRDHERYACDFSNLNAHLPQKAWTDIDRKTEQLRILYTMRDPVKRLWSHVKFDLQINNNLDKLDKWKPRDFDERLRLPNIWINAEYGAVLRNLKNSLAPEQFKVMFYEDLHADQRGTLRDIERFLEIPAFNYPQEVLDKRLTEGVRHNMPSFFPELVEKDVARIRMEIEAEGYVLPASWGQG